MKRNETKKSNEFGKHPSNKLQQIFSQKPFQIQEPEKAKIIFLGLDANLDFDIEQNKLFFNEMIDYFRDGVKYWKLNGIHTPMLKEIYKGNGKRYHKQFCKLGFSSNNAEDICFLELLNICTYGSSKGKGNSKMFMNMLNTPENKNHLNRVRNIFEMDNIICISKGVKKIIDKIGINSNRKNVIEHIHFSGSISNTQINDIRIKLWKYIN